MNIVRILSLILLFLMNLNISFCMNPKRVPVDTNKKQITKKKTRRKELNEREIAKIIASLNEDKTAKNTN